MKAAESVLIITDPNTQPIGELFVAKARTITNNVKHCTIPGFKMHGEEPPPDVAKQMLIYDNIISLTRMSMAHSEARLEATHRGAKYLSLPDYSYDVLSSKSLMADFKALTPIADGIAKILTDAEEIHVTSTLGTDFRCNVRGRTANSAPGWCYAKGTIASPPDAEANIAPIEDSSFGIVYVDGSIPCKEIGLLPEPVILEIENGLVRKISGYKSKELNALYDSLNTRKTRVVAELGIGLNPLAVLSGKMLEDEGCLGTVHLGFGSNSTIGGLNEVGFHLDNIIKNAVVTVDDKYIIENGVISAESKGDIGNDV